MGYKPMTAAQTLRDSSLSLGQAVQASVASFRDDFRKILGSEPIVNFEGDGKTFSIATYGAGVYKHLSSFSITQLPGCCGIAVFYHASVATDFQKKGLGTLLLNVREEAARKAGYSIAQATVLTSNKDEQSILEKNGWTKLTEFKNRRTGNKVNVLIKEL